MEWTIQFDAAAERLVVTVTGTRTAAPLKEMTRQLRDALLEHRAHQMLLDYTRTRSGLEPYEIFERPKILQELNFPADVRVAVLYETLDENTQFLENVYRNRNFSVRVFADRPQALAWLGEA